MIGQVLQLAPGRGPKPMGIEGVRRPFLGEGSNVFVRLDKIEATKGLFIHILSLFEGALVGMKLAFVDGAFEPPRGGSHFSKKE
jgi:hypothetical protein